MKKQKINNKEVKRRMVEEAAERLAQILILQVELSKSNSRENATMSSQQNYDNRGQKFNKMPKIKVCQKK